MADADPAGAIAAWRRKSPAEQQAYFDRGHRARKPEIPAVDPAVRDAVNACPDRGGELPVSAFINEGCCSGPTRWACSAGLGKVPGQPTLDFCLECQSRRLVGLPIKSPAF